MLATNFGGVKSDLVEKKCGITGVDKTRRYVRLSGMFDSWFDQMLCSTSHDLFIKLFFFGLIE